ncbi:MAG: ACT domain-containing protein [Candidatus Gastranaerophilales bacterium]|nr:ACT domain-containing protein [Candidatus Gastranaerophilales bacterium]
MKDTKIIVTIFGADKVGIVAEIARVMSQYSINIDDISQTIVQDYFVMFMICDIKKSTYNFLEIKEAIQKQAQELKMEVWVQKKAIFDNMHTI